MDFASASHHAPTAPLGMLPPPTPQHLDTQRYTKKEWEAHRPMIEGQLKNLKVKGVVGLLRERGFYITERQLKGKIKIWGLGKNVRGSEMQAIVLKSSQRKAEGKDTIFRVRGQIVDQSKIDRWQKRSQFRQQDPSHIITTSALPTTPSDISCSTVSPIDSASPYPTTISPINVPRDCATPRPLEPSTSMDVSRDSPALRLLESPMNPFREFNYGLAATSKSHFFSQYKDDPYRPPSPQVAEVSELERFISTEETAFNGSKRDLSTTSPTQRLGLNEWITSIQYFEENVAAKGYNESVRYRQKEEEELTKRLKGLLLKHGTNHPATLDTVARLAPVYMDQGNYRTASILYSQAARAWLIAAGDDDPMTLAAFIQLADAFRTQGKYHTAEQLSRLVYSKALASMSFKDPKLLNIRNVLARCCHLLGLDSEAEVLFRENIKVGGSCLAADSALLLEAMFSLSLLLKQRGEYTESRNILEQLLASDILSLGKRHRSTLKVRSLLAELSFLQNDSDAHRALEVVHTDQIKILGADHMDTLTTQMALALILLATGKQEESIALLEEATNRTSKMLDPSHSLNLEAKVRLAGALLDHQEFEKAAKIAESVSRLSSAAFGIDHRITCLCFTILGQAYHGQGLLKKAAAILQETALELERTMGKDCWLTKRCLAAIQKVHLDMVMLPNFSGLHGEGDSFTIRRFLASLEPPASP